MGLCREVCFKCLEKNQPVLTFNVFAFGIDWSNKFVSCPPQMIKTEFTDNPPKSRWLLSVEGAPPAWCPFRFEHGVFEGTISEDI